MSCKADKMDPKDMKVKLVIGGKEIAMVPFVHDSFRDMIIAFVNNLSGHEGGKINIIIDK
ncbi:hypothetical protein ACFLYK_01025 [Candidatus Cloacimonadota bacterium]